MTKNEFDPSKLNIDFSNIQPEEEQENQEKKEEQIAPSGIPVISQNQDILSSKGEIPSESVDPLQNGGVEKISSQNEESVKTPIDMDVLSTFLTDNDIRPEELKKKDEEKRNISEKENKGNESGIIFDININSINDILDILLANQYDMVMIDPGSELVRIIFKKDQVVKDTKNIKFHIYSNILLQAKKLSKLSLEETTIEQKGSGEYKLRDKNLEVLSKTLPGQFGEILYVKTKEIDKRVEKKSQVKKGVSAGTAFGFLGAILLIALILGAAFLTFVVFNAKTPSDVSFFQNLGINLNDVNSFLLKITTIVFSIVILAETIVLIIALFKGLLTKKEYKRKRIIYFIIAGILLTITGSTGSLWMYLDKAIKNLPNWQEMSYGNIQIFDNGLLKSENFDKANALIGNYTNIIGPIELKFDLTYLQKDEARRGFEIKKYIWDFGFGDKVETQTPEIIQNFDRKGNFKVDLILEGIDNRFPDKMTSKPASDMPTISISHLVKITQNSLDNGGRTISFDATDLKSLGEIEWYMKEDLSKPAFEGDYFQPSKIYFEEDAIGMKIVRKNNPNNYMDRVFIIAGEKSKITGQIKESVSIDDDLNYTLRVENLDNTPGAGFIKSFTWILEDKEVLKNADILKLEESSEINYTFKSYGKQIVSVIVTNTAGKSTTIKKEIDIPKRLKTKNQIDFYMENDKIENVKYDEKTREYTLYDIGVPTKIKFDAKMVRPDNPLYILEEIGWDVGGNGSIDYKEKFLEQNFEIEGFQDIEVLYTFVHRKDKNDVIKLKDKISLQLVEKDAIVSFEVKADSEYVPALVSFDASKSKAKNDNIVKFIYDYGDGIIEERDAINPGHRYLKEGNYTIKLTIVTETGKQYSKSKVLVLKSPLAEGKINVSMRKAPVGQEIDFLSTGSVGQIVGFHWNFGDGETSTEANPSHAFKNPGTYKVVLTLEYANRNIISLDTTVEITE